MLFSSFAATNSATKWKLRGHSRQKAEDEYGRTPILQPWHTESCSLVVLAGHDWRWCLGAQVNQIVTPSEACYTRTLQPWHTRILPPGMPTRVKSREVTLSSPGSTGRLQCSNPTALANSNPAALPCWQVLPGTNFTGVGTKPQLSSKKALLESRSLGTADACHTNMRWEVLAGTTVGGVSLPTPGTSERLQHLKPAACAHSKPAALTCWKAQRQYQGCERPISRRYWKIARLEFCSLSVLASCGLPGMLAGSAWR